MANVSESDDAELLAIQLALKMVVGSLKKGLPDLKRLVLFSDCMHVLRLISRGKAADHHSSRKKMLLQRTLEALEELQKKGVKVEMHWTPGHAGVSGNEKVDALVSQCFRRMAWHWPEESLERLKGKQCLMPVYLSNSDLTLVRGRVNMKPWVQSTVKWAEDSRQFDQF